jgi:hypothetical protein
MALRTAAAAAAAAPRGLRRLFSTTSNPAINFPPSAATATQQRETREPSTNLFVSGTFLVLSLSVFPFYTLRSYHIFLLLFWVYCNSFQAITFFLGFVSCLRIMGFGIHFLWNISLLCFLC